MGDSDDYDHSLYERVRRQPRDETDAGAELVTELDSQCLPGCGVVENWTWVALTEPTEPPELAALADIGRRAELLCQHMSESASSIKPVDLVTVVGRHDIEAVLAERPYHDRPALALHRYEWRRLAGLPRRWFPVYHRHIVTVLLAISKERPARIAGLGSFALVAIRRDRLKAPAWRLPDALGRSASGGRNPGQRTRVATPTRAPLG